MIHSYPERNPFPHQGTLNIDAARGATPPGPESQALPTLLLDPVRRLLELAARYLSGFTPSGEKIGLPVNLTGGHGSGKTHTIRYVMDQIDAGEIRPAEGVLSPFVIYVKAEDPDFMKVYGKIMNQVPLDTLADLSLRLLGVVAGEQFGQLLSDPKITQRAVELLRTDPSGINLLFERYLVSQDAVRQEQAAEIYRSAGDVREFQLVYKYLLDPELGPAAHAWLLGQPVPGDELRKLGLNRLLDTTELARRSLLLLATLFGRTGRPLLLFLDQYEKLVVTQDPALVERNVGLLRDLVDALPAKGIFLAIAGNEAAWSALSLDLRQRFAGNVIRLPVLTEREARHMVRLYLTAGSQHILKVLQPGKTEPLMELGGHALPIRGLAVSDDERIAVSASADGSLKVWDLVQGQELGVLRGHSGPVNAAALTPDGRTAVSASDDGTLKVWDISGGQGDGPPEPWDPPVRTALRTLIGHSRQDGPMAIAPQDEQETPSRAAALARAIWVNAVAISADGRLAASSSTDATARLWDLETGRQLAILTGHLDTIWDVAFTPDGKRLLTASSDGTLGVWDMASMSLQALLHGHTGRINQVQATPDGRLAITASDDATLRAWDLDNRSAWGEPWTGHTSPVRGLALSPDGRQAYSAAIDCELDGWEIPDGKQLFSLRNACSLPAALAVMPRSGRLLVSGQRAAGGQEGEADLYPFTGEAIHEMMRYGAGNIRRLLQLCFQVFNQAHSRRLVIDAALVAEALKDGSPFYFNRPAVLSQVEQLLGKSGLAFQRGYLVGDITVDLAALGAGGEPGLLIQVSEALFKDDEATQALLGLNLARAVQTQGLEAQVLLVALGYISPDVTPRLTEVVHNFIVYDPESFEERFNEVLEHLPRPSESAGRTQKVLQTLEKQYEDLRQRFEVLVTTSKQEVASLQTNVTQYVRQQALEKFEAERAVVRQDWAAMRRELEDSLRAARKEQRRLELEELEHLRERAERSRADRGRSLSILFGMGALIALAAGMVANLYLDEMDFVIYYTLYIIAVLSGVLAVLSYLDTAKILFNSPILRELAGPVRSLEELDRLARNRQILDRYPAARLLRHPNPHYRYAGAVNAEPERYAEELVQALLAERSVAVRRALVQQMLKNREEGYLNYAIERLASAPDDAVYLVEEAAGRGQLDLNLLYRLPPALTTLAALAGSGLYESRREDRSGDNLPLPEPNDSLAVRLVSVLRNEKFKWPPLMQILAKAYRSGLDRYTHPDLATLPEHQVRAAIAELSPLEEGGLGAYDRLRNLNEIDQMFLFFHQLLFYMEREVLAGPAVVSQADE